jgi:hypothetical protein
MKTRTAFRGTVLSRSAALIIVVLTALMLAAGAIAASGQVKQARAEDAVELTYTVWFAPAMTGFVGGDIVGTFGGGVVSTPIPNSPIVRLKALYVITANDPSESFTATLKGHLNTKTGSAVLNGVVTSGFMAGERVLSQFKVVGSCPAHPAGPCFPGTMRLT